MSFKSNFFHVSFLSIVSALSLSAHASTPVTLYGIVDTGYQWSELEYKGYGQKIKSNHLGMDDGYLKSNRWGLKGNETLANGAEVFFNLENKFYLSDGTSKGMFTKKAFLGFKQDSFGELSLGRQKTTSDNFIGVNAVRGKGKIKRAFGGVGLTVDNSIKYATPSFGGFKLGITYARDGEVVRYKGPGLNPSANDSDFKHFLSIGAQYKDGPWQISATFDRERGLDKNKHAVDYAVKNWVAGIAYDFELMKLGIAYGQDRHGKLNTAGDVKTVGGVNPNRAGEDLIGFYNTKGFKSHNYYVGISVPFEQSSLAFSWSRSSSNLNRLFLEKTGADLSTRSQQIFAAQATYSLSKRTTLYGYGAYTKGAAYLKDLTGKEVGIGLNHRF